MATIFDTLFTSLGLNEYINPVIESLGITPDELTAIYQQEQNNLITQYLLPNISNNNSAVTQSLNTSAGKITLPDGTILLPGGGTIPSSSNSQVTYTQPLSNYTIIIVAAIIILFLMIFIIKK